jgi:hypothetical protein
MSAAPLICEFPAPRGIGFYSDEPIERHPNRWLSKEAKFKACVLTTTRRAGGLDFRPAAEKTKARQCLQRYVCESKHPRGVKRTSCTPQRQRDGAQRRNWTIYEAIDIVSQTVAAGQVARAQDFDFFSWSATA